MRIGYFGDGPWAHNAFRRLILDETLEIVFVMVRYDKQDAVLMEMAREYQIPLEVCENINSADFIEKVRLYQVDLMVSMSFDQIFKKRLIELPPYGTINCHAGKLPFYRGCNILNWALINDEKEFGITVHYMDEGIDTGDIILQKTYPITDEDDYCTLLHRAYMGCAEVLYDAIKMIQNHTVSSIHQKDIDAVGMYCGRRRPGDEVIDWSLDSRRVFNFVRALCAPGPQATSWIDGKRISINKVRMVPGAHKYINTPGQVLGRTEQGFYVKTGDTMLEVVEYTYDGKIRIGDRLRANE